MRTKLLCLLLLTLFALPAAAQKSKASALLDRAAGKIRDSRGVTMGFSLVQIDDEIVGTLDLQGNQFRLQLPDMTIGYDGKTQWTLMESVQEVSLSEPNAEELAQTTPIVLLQSYKEAFDCEFAGKKGDITTVVLRPKNESEIKEAQIMVNDKRDEIVRLTLHQNDGNMIEIMLSAYETNKNFPAEHFVFDKEKYPEVEIIDLR